VGGSARYFAKVTTIAELEESIHFAQNNDLPVFVLGGGSNVLVPDEGFSGLVVLISIPGREYSVEETTVTLVCGAGEVFDEVVAETVALGYWGLENLSHIPGTVGATPVQNVGAYGVEVADLIISVTVYDCVLHQVRELTAEDCAFAYRDSLFKQVAGQSLIVLRVTFSLSITPQPRLTYADLEVLKAETDLSVETVRQTIIKIRAAKFPDWHTVGTAGSFFKNPIIPIPQAELLQAKYPQLAVYPVTATTAKVPLGFILDKVCGLRGIRIGNVGLYEAQALVLVAYQPVTAAMIDEFADMVVEKVYSTTAISIEREVQTLNKNSRIK
jgi:UDP-N-acetylmuramate dehydrogenase